MPRFICEPSRKMTVSVENVLLGKDAAADS